MLHRAALPGRRKLLKPKPQFRKFSFYNTMERIGLIAGRGNFPLLFAQEAKKAGFYVVVVAVKGNAKRQLRKYADAFFWVDVRHFKNIAGIFKGQVISKVAMAGQINPYFLFDPAIMNTPDVRDFFGVVEDRRADTVFTCFVNKLEAAGLHFMDSTSFLSAYLPGTAILTKRKPTPEEDKDIQFGFKLAKHLGRMDIGQTVCVKQGVVLAVESIEGTDNAIKRAISLARSPIVLVKTSKPSQDMRFDVPVVGLKTIKNLPCGSCVAIEAARTLLLDQKEALILADRKGIALTSVSFSSAQ